MRGTRAFTLIELLIVVVILGILAAIVVPSFSRSTQEASAMATLDQLIKVREALSVYYFRNHSQFPSQITEGDGTWGELNHSGGEYLCDAPVNLWVNGSVRTRVLFRDTPDTAYQSSYAWIFDPASGNVWAGSFDANDKPLQQP